jgi:alpha-tubulin suppressor-like RCC1 family protein
VAAGLRHFVALKADGSLWAWGLNPDGQVGQPNLNTNYDTPTRIGHETNWIKISSSYFHNLALKDDHSLWAWGLNLYGQLGDGTTSNRSAPVMIGMDRDWQTIAAGGHSSYALKINGTLWGWGADFATTTLAPRQIAPGTNWLAISSDAANLLIALKTDGTLWLRGRRFNLLATHFDAGGVDALTQVGLDSDWSEIYAGRDSFFARKKNGRWWVCGLNTEGQLGVGGIDVWVPSPKPLRFDFEPWAFAPGEGTTLLLSKDGKLWTWGRRWGAERSRVPLPPLARRFRFLNSLFVSGIDQTPHLLWELPPEVRRSLGTEPKGSTK